MSKIVQAINVMIASKDKIGDVRQGSYNDEYFFSYNSKYVWSILRLEDTGDFVISNYPLPSGRTVAEYTNYLSTLELTEFTNMNYVFYSTLNLKTREAKESFSELFTILKEMFLGIDKTLDDIIKSFEPPF